MKIAIGILAASLCTGTALADGHGVFVGGFEMTKDKTVV